MRIFYYGVMCMSEDIDSQKRGYVFLGLNMNMNSGDSRSTGDFLKGTRLLSLVANTLPIRTSSIHVCGIGMRVKAIASIARFCLERYAKFRVRDHYGESFLAPCFLNYIAC